MKAYIKDIEVYLPKRVVTNEDISKYNPEWDTQKILNKVGIQSRHMATDDESSFTLAYSACNNLLKRKNSYKDEIDYILYSTLNHEHFMMLSSALLQNRLGLKKECGSVDLRLSCTGYLQMLSIAKALIISGQAKNVLLVTSDTYSKLIDNSDIGTYSIFGDAATATIVSNEGWAEIGEIYLGVDGVGTENHIYRTQCINNSFPSDDIKLNESSILYRKDKFYMVGSEIFNFVTRVVPEQYSKFLDENDYRLEDIDMHIFHQANKYMLSYLRKKMNIPEDKFYINMSDVGNTSTSSIPISLYRIKSNLKQYNKIGLCSFGGGYTWASSIITIL